MEDLAARDSRRGKNNNNRGVGSNSASMRHLQGLKKKIRLDVVTMDTEGFHRPMNSVRFGSRRDQHRIFPSKWGKKGSEGERTPASVALARRRDEKDSNNLLKLKLTHREQRSPAPSLTRTEMTARAVSEMASFNKVYIILLLVKPAVNKLRKMHLKKKKKKRQRMCKDYRRDGST